MRTFFNYFFVVFLFSSLLSCTKEKIYADIIFINGNIYTVDSLMPKATFIAVSKNRIIGVGEKLLINHFKGPKTEIIDLNNSFVMPGFIEGHGHFGGFGEGLQNLNFLRAKSWNEIVEMVEKKVMTAKPGEWIVGRGWHQEKWKKYQIKIFWVILFMMN